MAGSIQTAKQKPFQHQKKTRLYQRHKKQKPEDARKLKKSQRKRRTMNHVIDRPLTQVFEDLLLERRAQELFERFGIPTIMGGAAGAWTFTNAGRTSLLNGDFDMDSDTWKMALFLSTSNIGSGSTTYAGLTNEHANANGYTTGGIAITLTLAGTTTVTVDIATDPTWTASGGSIVARFAVIYEVSGKVLCYCLLDSTPADVTVTDGNTLTVAAHASGVFTLA
jgi:hypothetical protein